MDRREFIGYGSAAALTAAFVKTQVGQEAEAQVAGQHFELHMEEIYEELIDGEVVFALAFRDPVTRALRPPLKMRQATTTTMKLVNKTRKARRFAITGWPNTKFPVIPAGQSATISFTAPPAGTYIYHEVSEGSAGRVLGLHGVITTWHAGNKTPAGNATPYNKNDLTPELIALFDAFGTHGDFPGGKWQPGREIIWLMSQVDPVVNQAAERNELIDLNPLVYNFRPRYFTLNGLSGYDAAHDEATVPKGYIGEPMLIRTANAGIAAHAPHIHGNHILRLTENSADGKFKGCDNVYELDTWCLKALERVDVMLPFKKPDEIPHEVWPPRQEPFPLLYPMHCHCEMSQTAGGGNYPQGLVTHWELLGMQRAGA